MWIEVTGDGKNPHLVNLGCYADIFVCPVTGTKLLGRTEFGMEEIAGNFPSEDIARDWYDRFKALLLKGSNLDQDWDNDDGLQGTGLEWLRRTDPNHPDIKDEEFEEVF